MVNFVMISAADYVLVKSKKLSAHHLRHSHFTGVLNQESTNKKTYQEKFIYMRPFCSKNYSQDLIFLSLYLDIICRRMRV